MNVIPPQGSRERLIEATLRSVAEHGSSRSTVRTIAEAAGVAPSLAIHHFDGKGDLMVDAYRQFRERLVTRCLAGADRREPVKRLAACIRTILYDNDAHKEYFRMWAGLLDLVLADVDASAARVANDERYVRARNSNASVSTTQPNPAASVAGFVRAAPGDGWLRLPRSWSKRYCPEDRCANGCCRCLLR